MKKLTKQQVEDLQRAISDPTGMRGDFERYIESQRKDTIFNRVISILSIIIATIALVVAIISLLIQAGIL